MKRNRMVGKIWLMVAAAALATACLSVFAEPALVPRPQSLETRTGEFSLSSTTILVVPRGDKEAANAARQFAGLVQQSHGITLTLAERAPKDGAIRFQRGSRAGYGAEGYRLQVSPDGITATAATGNGLFYAAVTLWQSLGRASYGAVPVPAMEVRDAPRFGWRGIMLDSARHYQSPEFIHRFIEWMAVHKLNVLQWHLTDDQAWRLEIKKYPRLTEVAAWRVPAGAAPHADIDPATGKPRLYGGFYSQDTVRELVKYAADRGITIVPEIDLPGHCSAMLTAFPELASSDHPLTEVPADWGIYPNVCNPGEVTFTFFQNVLTEVMALFPSHYIHTGGDEVDKTQWEQSAKVQARMKEIGVQKTADLQTYFTRRIGRFLQSHGRRLIGWDEILMPGLQKDAVVMSWRGIDGALAAAAKDYDTILSPWPTLYLDNRQGTAADEPPGRLKVIALEDVYAFEPMPPKLAPNKRKHVLGLQANLWTEHIRTEDRAAMMTFPRAAAVAELGWSDEKRHDWPGFQRRLAALLPRYRALQMPYDDSAYAARADVQYTREEAKVTLAAPVAFAEIRYTLDGAEPGADSKVYRGPFAVKLPAELKSATFLEGQALSRSHAVPLRFELAQRRKSQELKLCSEGIPISLEDDGPVNGPRAIFLADVQRPCWIFKDADLSEVKGIAVAVGQIPFNFQIGKLVEQIRFPVPQNPGGELEVHKDSCEGEMLARLPLAPALASNAVTVLPEAALTPEPARHDLCLRFAQKFDYAAGDPLWLLDWVQLVPKSVGP